MSLLPVHSCLRLWPRYEGLDSLRSLGAFVFPCYFIRTDLGSLPRTRMVVAKTWSPDFSHSYLYRRQRLMIHHQTTPSGSLRDGRHCLYLRFIYHFTSSWFERDSVTPKGYRIIIWVLKFFLIHKRSISIKSRLDGKVRTTVSNSTSTTTTNPYYSSDTSTGNLFCLNLMFPGECV